MHDLKKIRLNPAAFQQAISARKVDINFDELLQLDETRRALLNGVEEKKSKQNRLGKQIGQIKKKCASSTELLKLTEELRLLRAETEECDLQINALSQSIDTLLSKIPNCPATDVPSNDNLVLREYGTPRTFLWEPKTWLEIGVDLKLFSLSSSKEAPNAYFGYGARLLRSLLQYALSVHIQNGFSEIRSANFWDHSFPLSLFANQIVEENNLPFRYCFPSITPDGSENIQLIELTKPDASSQALDAMLSAAEQMFQALNLPYRIVMLCTDELAFEASKSIALEVWLPSRRDYVRVTTCSDCGDFIARQHAIRFRAEIKEKPLYVGLLYDCSIRTDLILAAILENHQNDDGSVSIPQMLQEAAGIQVIR